MKNTSIFISTGLFSILLETSLGAQEWFSEEYRHHCHRSCPYSNQQIYLLFKMIGHYDLPLDPLSEWAPESVQQWEKIINKNPKMWEKLKKISPNHPLSSLKTEAELIQDAIYYEQIPVNIQEIFTGIFSTSDKFKNLSSDQLESFLQVQRCVEDFHRKAFNF
jgi:hypothetical protein